MAPLAERIAALDPALFSQIATLTPVPDRRALLALHGAAAGALGAFAYLEVGSYLGGSLQVVMQDPRCTHVVSIDPRPALTPDKRDEDWRYEDNTTAAMRAALAALPAADLTKLTTIDAGTAALRPADLPVRPDLCFVDAEHTDEAVLADARFCREALAGGGVIAFHDHLLLRPGIEAFLREAWADVSLALAFRGHRARNGGVFAVELGGRGILREPIVRRAAGARWRVAAWRAGCAWRRSPGPLLAGWGALARADDRLFALRAGRPRLRGRGAQTS